ncbi:YciI family protein [Acidimangrovimonas pyrenivorans]|uniref:YciI family protein n=1 Tax=Acidimangrovimonas pyrenivorans TaxID=2030798 RepID=A0ABV7AMR8_9RHOB
MSFAVICHDKPGALQVRKDNRDAHLAYIEETGVVTLAGPFLNEDGEMCGSLVILSVGTLEAARAWAAGDPYAKAGLFDKVEVTAWKKVIG